MALSKFNCSVHSLAFLERTDVNLILMVFSGSSNKRVFNTSLQDHLDTTGRKISYVIELCVCCLLEKGLYEEGLLRVGCGKR
jgi:hypothetical protein